MARPSQDLTGRRFGRLLAVEKVVGAGRSRWLCRCDCGIAVVAMAERLLSENTKSCGCLQAEIRAKRHEIAHGHAKRGMLTPTYTSWVGMLQRCQNPKLPKYKDYGGRGITVCERWQKFANFLEDMGEAPAGLTIDRIDTNGSYEPANCQWADQKTQQSNRRNNRYVMLDGKRLTITEAARHAGMSRQTIRRRLIADPSFSLRTAK